MPSGRRGFLAKLVGGLTSLVTTGVTPQPGDDWMKALTAPHRTAFDVTAHKNGKPLGQAKNFLDAWRDAFHTPERDVNLVFGIHGEALPFALNDALWDRYKIGEQYQVVDDASKSTATRNVFTPAIETLQQRGVKFILCMNSVANASRKLAAAGLGSADEIHTAILAGLVPGVMTVPAMNVALTQLQEHGLKYEKLD